MKICGIVAEFNPFHNGHAYLIQKARESGYSGVVAVMSGNFVQRGEPAIIETESRVRAALDGGVDLVLQLPVNHALSGASDFSRGAVGILDASGVIDALVFGSECGDAGLLAECARALNDKRTDERTVEELKTGISYACARERALEATAPGLSHIINEPNNILAVEYIRQLDFLGSAIRPVTFLRTSYHDSDEIKGKFTSASNIRKMIMEGSEFCDYIPGFYAGYDDFNIVDLNKFEAAVLCDMRKKTSEDFALAPDISEGIENRIADSIPGSVSLAELYSAAKTKRYSHARIRRIVMNTFIGITAEDSAVAPQYIRPLGMTGRGAEILGLMKNTASLPIISRTSGISGLPAGAQKLFGFECRATGIFTACLVNPLSASTEKDRKMIKKA